MSPSPRVRPAAWKWYVCGLLLLATMLNYMDRQTLSQVATDIKAEFARQGLRFDDRDYGLLESGFGMAFAIGALVTGFIADRVSIRWMYPAVLVGWSAAGFATAWATSFQTLLVCRIMLGFFEAGQWPCALTVSQRILSRRDRPLGNGILQSGAAMGAILTPLVVRAMTSDVHGTWRGPFQVIGALGLLWTVPWLVLVRPGDLARPSGAADSPHSTTEKPASARKESAMIRASGDDGDAIGTPHKVARASPAAQSRPGETAPPEVTTRSWGALARRFLVLSVVVVMINLCWHLFRAWLPKFLREFHHYDRAFVDYFTSAYYLAADAGSILVGLATQQLVRRGWRIHSARLALFFVCALFTALSTIAAVLPAGWPLLGLLLVIGFGALGLFPNYYTFTQELSDRHQGKVTGTLSFLTWVCTAYMHPIMGEWIDRTGSYTEGVFLAGLAPAVGLLALLLFWNWPPGRLQQADAKSPRAAPAAS